MLDDRALIGGVRSDALGVLNCLRSDADDCALVGWISRRAWVMSVRVHLHQ